MDGKNDIFNAWTIIGSWHDSGYVPHGRSIEMTKIEYGVIGAIIVVGLFVYIQIDNLFTAVETYNEETNLVKDKCLQKGYTDFDYTRIGSMTQIYCVRTVNGSTEVMQLGTLEDLREEYDD